MGTFLPDGTNSRLDRIQKPFISIWQGIIYRNPFACSSHVCSMICFARLLVLLASCSASAAAFAETTYPKLQYFLPFFGSFWGFFDKILRILENWVQNFGNFLGSLEDCNVA